MALYGHIRNCKQIITDFSTLGLTSYFWKKGSTPSIVDVNNRCSLFKSWPFASDSRLSLSKLNQGGFYNIILFCRFDEEDKNEPFGFHVFPSCCHCCCCCCRAETCKDWRWWQATAQQVQAKLSINVLIKKKKETTHLSTRFLYMLLYMYN